MTTRDPCWTLLTSESVMMSALITGTVRAVGSPTHRKSRISGKETSFVESWIHMDSRFSRGQLANFA